MAESEPLEIRIRPSVGSDGHSIQMLRHNLSEVEGITTEVVHPEPGTPTDSVPVPNILVRFSARTITKFAQVLSAYVAHSQMELVVTRQDRSINVISSVNTADVERIVRLLVDQLGSDNTVDPVDPWPRKGR